METKELDFFRKQMESNIKKAASGRVVLTSFLDETKQSDLLAMRCDGVCMILDGGFDGAEYKRAILKPVEIEANNFKIKQYEILYHKRFLELTHRKVLGSLMSLGIERDSIGDIIFLNDAVYFACTEELSKYIVNSFKTISGIPIELREQKERLQVQKTLVEKTYLVSSMRLDVIVAAACKLSRSEAAEWIMEGLVQLNHRICKNTSKIVVENDIISVRHKGRIYVQTIGGQTRSGRINIKLGFLVS